MQLSLLQHFFSTGLTFSVAFVNDAILYQFSCSLPSLHWRFTEWIELSLIVHCTVSTHGMLCEIFKSARTRYTRTINIGRPSRSFKLLHIENNMPVKILNHCVPVITSVALTRVTGFYWKIKKKSGLYWFGTKTWFEWGRVWKVGKKFKQLYKDKYNNNNTSKALNSLDS